MKFFKYGKNTEKLNDIEIKSQKLTDEEIKELTEIENNRHISASADELNKYKKIQKQNKTKPVLIRFSAEDLELIKLKAASEGLPYQTFIKSTIHKILMN